jgi:hypothetical protein
MQVPDSPWLGKQVRVVREGPDEGRAGEVKAVLRVRDSDPAEYALNVFENTGTSKCGGIFQVRHPRVEEERPDAEAVKPEKLDYRVLTVQARKCLATKFGINEVEYIFDKQTLELGTVHTMMGELELRIKPENTILVPPSVAITCYEGMPGDHGGEMEKFLDELEKFKHIYVVVQSDFPSHYTMLHIERMENDEVRIEFKDSLKSNPPTARAAATRFLRGANLIKAPAEAPESSSEAFQNDGWSCGLWATRSIERSLREHLGERRQPPRGIKALCDQANFFIKKIKDSSKDDKAKAAPKPKPQPKGKVLKASEPVHETWEHALAAANACSKCVETRAGTKGCRACMGEWFEEIRMKHYNRI